MQYLKELLHTKASVCLKVPELAKKIVPKRLLLEFKLFGEF